MFYVKCYVNTLSNNDKSHQLVQCHQQSSIVEYLHEVMRELCVELIYNYYFNEHSFSFAYVHLFSISHVMYFDKIKRCFNNSLLFFMH